MTTFFCFIPAEEEVEGCPVCLSVCLQAVTVQLSVAECCAQYNVAGEDINTTTCGRVVIYYTFHNQTFKITRHVTCPPYHRNSLTLSSPSNPWTISPIILNSLIVITVTTFPHPKYTVYGTFTLQGGNLHGERRQTIRRCWCLLTCPDT